VTLGIDWPSTRIVRIHEMSENRQRNRLEIDSWHSYLWEGILVGLGQLFSFFALPVVRLDPSQRKIHAELVDPPPIEH
jgi:hypothetical protein